MIPRLAWGLICKDIIGEIFTLGFSRGGTESAGDSTFFTITHPFAPCHGSQKAYAQKSMPHYTENETMPASLHPSDEWRVSFNPMVRSRRALHWKDYTVREVERCWYSCQEQDIMRKEALLSFDTSKDNGVDLERAMEHRTISGRQSRLRNTAAAISAVLDEQDLQIARGVFDPQAIALTYRKVSDECMLAAQIRGENDHCECVLPILDVVSTPEMTKALSVCVEPALIDLPHKEYHIRSWTRNGTSTAAA